MKVEMSERAREARKEYMKRWRKQNGKKAAEAEARKWERYADRIEAEKAEETKEEEKKA